MRILMPPTPGQAGVLIFLPAAYPRSYFRPQGNSMVFLLPMFLLLRTSLYAYLLPFRFYYLKVKGISLLSIN